jgi:two-component system LytT family response regulator
MKILRAIIIDDEQKGIDTLKILIWKFIGEVKVVATTTDPEEAIELIENYEPEIVFLDINMPEMTGFELLEKITWKNFDLVFTTAHQEHALKALKINAIDYILKPIDFEDLRSAVSKIINKVSFNENSNTTFNFNELLNTIQQYHKQKIIINSKSGIESIDVHEIISLESQSNYTQIYLENSRIILTSKSLKEFDNELCRSNVSFMRIHHSYIINLQKVSRYLKVQDNIVMNNSQKIPVSKSRKESFFNWLNI